MKSLLLPLLFVSLAAPLSAAVVYSGTQNLSVSWDDLEGVYLNMATGEMATTYPVDFDDGAWLNLTLGGAGIFNGDLLRPWATSAGAYDPLLESDYYLNLTVGTLVDSAAAFVVDGWGSTYHMGASGDVGKFVTGETGFLAFEFQEEAGGDTFYGWLRMTPDTGGEGMLVDWAFNDAAGEGILVGAVPEPSVCGVLFSALAISALRRRRG